MLLVFHLNTFKAGFHLLFRRVRRNDLMKHDAELSIPFHPPGRLYLEDRAFEVASLRENQLIRSEEGFRDDRLDRRARLRFC